MKRKTHFFLIFAAQKNPWYCFHQNTTTLFKHVWVFYRNSSLFFLISAFGCGFNECRINFVLVSPHQMWMNVRRPMEAVRLSAVTPLEVSTAGVLRDWNWMKMAKPVKVSPLQYLFGCGARLYISSISIWVIWHQILRLSYCTADSAYLIELSELLYLLGHQIHITTLKMFLSVNIFLEAWMVISKNLS